MVVKSKCTGWTYHSVQEIIWQCRIEIGHKLWTFGRLAARSAKIGSRIEYRVLFGCLS